MDFPLFVDFHGLTLEEAESKVHEIIGNSRISGRLHTYKFITGNGQIKRSMVEWLKDYGITPEEEWGNSGVLNITID